MSTTIKQANGGQSTSTKAAKQSFLTFYSKTYFQIQNLATCMIQSYQPLLDALSPEMKAILPEQFEFADLETLFKQQRVKQLPGYEQFEAAGINLTAQVKLQLADLALIEEVANPSFSQGNIYLQPKGRFRYIDDKVSIEGLEDILSYGVLTLSGFELEVYNSLTKLHKSLFKENTSQVDIERVSWFLSPAMVSYAKDWTLEGEACVIDPASVKKYITILSQFK